MFIMFKSIYLVPSIVLCTGWTQTLDFTMQFANMYYFHYFAVVETKVKKKETLVKMTQCTAKAGI